MSKSLVLLVAGMTRQWPWGTGSCHVSWSNWLLLMLCSWASEQQCIASKWWAVHNCIYITNESMMCRSMKTTFHHWLTNIVGYDFGLFLGMKTNNMKESKPIDRVNMPFLSFAVIFRIDWPFVEALQHLPNPNPHHHPLNDTMKCCNNYYHRIECRPIKSNHHPWLPSMDKWFS